MSLKANTGFRHGLLFAVTVILLFVSGFWIEAKAEEGICPNEAISTFPQESENGRGVLWFSENSKNESYDSVNSLASENFHRSLIKMASVDVFSKRSKYFESTMKFEWYSIGLEINWP